MTVTIHKGDCRDILRSLPSASVHCIVSSPPYWRQRDYGVASQLGLEETPEEYTAELVSIFREARRVLRPDGTAWVNLGDKWASGGNGGGGSFMADRGEAWAHAKRSKGWRKPPAGYKDKDLIGLPFMFAFAMRADGWFWRQCNVWAKPNAMPESVSDRSTISHEYVLHFSKRNDYWYDADAARTPAAPNGANLRSVWWVAPAQYRDAHYAVMPDTIAEICITAGCPKGGTVLDLFGGVGTTGMVADRLGRNAILIELNPDYVAMAERRIKDDAGMFASIICEVP